MERTDMAKKPAADNSLKARVDMAPESIQWLTPPDKVTPEQKAAAERGHAERVAEFGGVLDRLKKAAGTEKVKAAVQKVKDKRKQS